MCAWSSLITDVPHSVNVKFRRVEMPGDKANIAVEIEGALPSDYVEKALVLSLVKGHIPMEISLKQKVSGPGIIMNITLDRELAKHVYVVIIVFKGEEGREYSVVAIDRELVDKYFNPGPAG